MEVGIGITLLLTLLGFFFQNKFFFYIQLLWLMLMSSLNTNGADWINNFNTFQVATIDSSDPFAIFTSMYDYLAFFAKAIGMNYVTFNCILTSISTLLIAYVIFRLAKKPTIVISLMFIYPFIDNIIQKRWYYAMGIIIFGIYEALKMKNKWMRTLVLLVSAYFAYQFHTGAILYLTLPVYLLFPNKLQNYLTGITLVVGTIGRNSIATFVNMVTGGAFIEKSNLYFSVLSANSTVSHYLFWMFWQLLQASIVFYIYKRKPTEFCSFVWRLNVWAMCVIPLYSFDPVFSRIFRVVLIFNYIVIANSFWEKKLEISKSGLTALMSQLVFVAISLYAFDLNSDLGVQTIVFDIFKYNQFLNLF